MNVCNNQLARSSCKVTGGRNPACGIKEENYLASAAECSKTSWRLRGVEEVNGCSIVVDRREKSDYFRDTLRTKE